MFFLQLQTLSGHSDRNRWQIITEAGSCGLAEVHYFSSDIFKFLTGGQEVAGTVRRHVGHWFDSQ